MSKKYILRSKWFLSMAVLLLFATANAQEITKEKEPARFGIGIAYGFKDRVKELIHPIELTERYNLSEKHSFYVNVPLGCKSWRDDYASVDPVIRGYYTHKMRLYGLGIGYDYSIVSYKNLDLFAGGGLEYQRFYNRYQEVQEGDAAAWIKANMKKPVAAFISGQQAPPGKRMGRACIFPRAPSLCLLSLCL